MHTVVAEVWRGDFLESVHHGTVLATAPDGSDSVRIGDVDAPMYPRSSNKPLQALGMLRAGLELDGPLLALGCASHSGEDIHLTGVREVLASAGLGTEALRCTAALPIGEGALRSYLAGGGQPSPLTMNCSGKHAAMLATCVTNGWDTASYLDPRHPLQVRLRETLEEMAGETVAATGIDGCGAPLFAISLRGLARAFGRLASAPEGSLEHRVVRAMNTYPQYVGGTGRDVTRLMGALPGAVAKDGAEGVYALGLPDGSAVALKIADGSQRSRPVVMVAALRHLGVDVDGDETLTALATAPVLGHGEPVGAVRPTF
ncbi:asparaginase [Streptomyces tsukubensis]|uniref:Asparaginase n=1 Tax=Streptomyces tsukubensis TaxID=83656 RepID=A0A1V4A9H4_9ACTN|nr:asparaginase [Streptomyces tsukubensis]OON79156.1 asparaginase [Streptomyces tsukubensis]QFR94733.1 asparaginase [Streptomyces tsukubensis]